MKFKELANGTGFEIPGKTHIFERGFKSRPWSYIKSDDNSAMFLPTGQVSKIDPETVVEAIQLRIESIK